MESGKRVKPPAGFYQPAGCLIEPCSVKKQGRNRLPPLPDPSTALGPPFFPFEVTICDLKSSHASVNRSHFVTG